MVNYFKNVFFKPWVGEHYFTTGFNNKKILILGESHYCGEGCETCGIVNDNKCESFTTDVIEEFFHYKQGIGPHKKWMNTFTKFANVFNGTQITNDEQINFWNSVIFYNYIQIALDGPRISPNEQNFKQSELAFFEILNEYKPDLIIAWGVRLWDRLPDNGRWAEVILDGSSDKFYNYPIENKEIPSFNIYHPSSSAFNYDQTLLIKQAISLI